MKDGRSFWIGLGVVLVAGLGAWMAGLFEGAEPDSGPTAAPGGAPTAEGPQSQGPGESLQPIGPTSPFEERKPDKPGEPETPPTEVADQGLVLSGRVLSGDAALPGAQVELLDDFSSTPALVQMGRVQSRVETDAEGRFTFPGLAASMRWILRVRHPEHAMKRVTGIDLSRSAARHQLIRLDAGQLVSGHARRAGGAPLEGVTVTVFDLGLQAYEPEQQQEASAVTGPDGKFVLPAIGKGLKRVVATRDDLATASTPTLRVDGPRSDVDFTMGEGQAIRGRVLEDGTDAPIPGARVAARLAARPGGARGAQLLTVSTVADEEGRFALRGLHLHDYMIWAHATGHQPSGRQTIPAGQSGVMIRMRRAASIRGSVVDAASGRPVSRYTIVITARPDLVIVAPGRRSRVDDSEGRFEVRGVSPGRHYLVVRAPGYVETISDPLLVSSGQQMTDVQIKLGHGATLSGRIENGAGEAIPKARLKLTRTPKGMPGVHGMLGPIIKQHAQTLRAQSSADGSFRVRNLRAGDWQIQVEHPDYAADREVEVTLLPDEQKKLPPIALVRGGRVVGTVKGRAGKPDPKARIVLQGRTRSDFRREATTGPDGRFVFDGVPPGDYYLNVTQRDGMINFADVIGRNRPDREVHTIRPSETLEVEL